MAIEPPAKKKCLGVDCPNDAGSLQCPTCLKLGIKDSFFCSQDCFKKNWVSCPVLTGPAPEHIYIAEHLLMIRRPLGHS